MSLDGTLPMPDPRRHPPRTPAAGHRRILGFTLIELMITVAIVGILAAIAYPSYQDQVRKSNRAAAQSYLMELAQRQQAFLLDARRYAIDLEELGDPPVPQRVQDFFDAATIATVATNPRPNFTIQIAAKAGTMQVRDAAATMSITHDGVKSPAAYW